MTHAAPPLAQSPESAAPPPGRRLLTDLEVAEFLGLGPSYVRLLGRRGALPRVQIGRAVRYDRHDVEAFLLARKVAAA